MKYFRSFLNVKYCIHECNDSVKYILYGTHDARAIDKLVNNFIYDYVLCPGCKSTKLETSLVKKIFQDFQLPTFFSS